MSHILKLSDFPIFYINCENAEERRLQTETQLELYGCDYTRVEAYQKEDWTMEELDVMLPNFVKKKSPEASKAEMCCYLSHLKALEMAGDNPCIIMEDDNIITTDVIGEAPPANSMISYLCGSYWLRGKFTNCKLSLDLPLGFKRDPWMLIHKSYLKIGSRNAILYHEPAKVLSVLKTNKPRPFSACLVLYIQDPFSTYVRQPSMILPDFNFRSSVTNPGKRILTRDRIRYQ